MSCVRQTFWVALRRVSLYVQRSARIESYIVQTEIFLCGFFNPIPSVLLTRLHSEDTFHTDRVLVSVLSFRLCRHASD